MLYPENHCDYQNIGPFKYRYFKLIILLRISIIDYRTASSIALTEHRMSTHADPRLPSPSSSSCHHLRALNPKMQTTRGRAEGRNKVWVKGGESHFTAEYNLPSCSTCEYQVELQCIYQCLSLHLSDKKENIPGRRR
jgi:hypothetical protein